MSYKGTRWHKCDLHIHTSASSCYDDEHTSPKELVQRAIEVGLDCIAVTDHNTGASIDAIKESAKGTKLTVFPGVEVTCSDAKVHLLLIFDTSKTTQNVEDLLIALKLDRMKLGQKDAHIHLEVHEVAKRAHEAGALVIPAHVDDYNGLSVVAHEAKKRVFEHDFITGVQIVHKQLLDKHLQLKDNTGLRDYFSAYYGHEINVEKIKEWKSCLEFIQDKAILTFSDNPSEQGSSKHGLWGIGNRYTWLKLGPNPNIESLRQCLLVPSLRVRNIFDSVGCPYTPPKAWIRSLKVENTTVTATGKLFEVEFSPQMTNIIGGRGSGKSSIIKFIRGVFDRTRDIEKLDSIWNEFSEFFSQTDPRGMGVLKETSVLTVEFELNDQLYKVVVSNIVTAISRTTSIYRFDPESKKWIVVVEEEFLSLFQLDIYSQKQIYEVAQFPNALRERVDSAIPEVPHLSGQIDEKTAGYLSACAQIREHYAKLSDEGKLKAGVGELETQVKSYRASGIEDLLEKLQSFAKEREAIDSFAGDLHSKQQRFKDLLAHMGDCVFDPAVVSGPYKDEIAALIAKPNAELKQIRSEILSVRKKVEEIAEQFDVSVKESIWQKSSIENEELVASKKIELSEKGVEDIGSFELLLEQLQAKRKQISAFSTIRSSLEELKKSKIEFSNQITNLRKEITRERTNFLNSILEGQNVKITVEPFRDRTHFEAIFRETAQRSGGFENGINMLLDKTFEGNVIDKLQEVRKDLLILRKGQDVAGYDGHFRNLIRDLTDEQFDTLTVLLPEDQIQASYRSSESKEFRSISNASAGQKTSSILTFILSHGTTPLILDQPEDDLDNHLVYGLIVDRLRESKEKRQIIVVTHNANIPVNGDAEYIIAMDSESKVLSVWHEGTIEEDDIKREICDVMEGGVDAFKLRSQRYNLLKVK